ncbi:hypothetical protein LBMAG53_20200 [Planctomycetota bacterium]|nr:hypothetical protein LBMAG53_20200 [Planctomycetota bacterium]
MRHVVCLLLLMAVCAAADPLTFAAGGRGLAVHVHGEVPATARTLALAKAGEWVIHALANDAHALSGAIRGADLDDRIQVEPWTSSRLPHANHAVDLLVVETGVSISDADIRRVLSPSGTALIAEGNGWKTVPGLPAAGADDWTHQRHGADGNAVSRDAAFDDQQRAIPNQLRWIADTTEAWPESVRVAGGRFLLFDKKPKDSKNAWIRARSAWNGMLLWESVIPDAAPGSSPGKVRNRPIATANRIYLRNQRIVAVDATNGKEVASTQLITFDLIAPADGATGVIVARTAEAVIALDARDLTERWRVSAPLSPADLAIEPRSAQSMAERLPGVVSDGQSAFAVRDGTTAVGWSLADGRETWSSAGSDLGSHVVPILVANGVLIVAGGAQVHGLPITGRGQPWKVTVAETVTDKKTQKTTTKPGDALRLVAKCAMVVKNRLWLQDSLTTRWNGAETNLFPVMGWVGIDLGTGAIDQRVGYPVIRPWGGIGPDGQLQPSLDQPVVRNWSPRCYADIATGNAILSQTMELVGVAGEEPQFLRGVRGHCGIGFTLGSLGLLSPPNQCIGCYPMVRGAVGYEPASESAFPIPDDQRLVRGPAFAIDRDGSLPAAKPHDWPMYRRDPLRTGCTPVAFDPGSVKESWATAVGGQNTQALITRGLVVVAAVDRGRITALDEGTGNIRWQVGLPGRIDTAPTIHGDRVFVGCHDGRVYALDLYDGRQAWRFTAAAAERRIVNGEHVESPWPVIGAVLFHDGAIHAMAGHLSALDGGLQRWALDPATGIPKWYQVFKGLGDTTGGGKAVILPTHAYRHDEHALNNVLLGGEVDGQSVVRLYDEWGGWDFRTSDGTLLRQHGAVPQPGFPVGRVSPGPIGAADRWPWVGHDRVTAGNLLRGLPITHEKTLETDPRTRFSGSRGNFFLFPAPGAMGVLITVKDGATTIDPEPWLIPTDPKIFTTAGTFAKDPARLAVDPGGPQRFPIVAAGALLTGGNLLWIAGSVTETPGQSALIAITLPSGKEVGRWTFAGAVAFEGVSANDRSVVITQNDGMVRRFAQR